MVSSDIEWLFTNIPMQETINLCVQKLFDDENYMLTVTMTE